tara:strand:+ start:2064 stop:2345 length:282 start_codon:yes stop_codon:yes gene_type:complete
MSFGGSVQHMISSLKQNAALKNARRHKFKGGNDYSNISTTKTAYNIPTLSKTALNILKNKIRKEAETENKKQLLCWIVGVIAVLIIILMFNFY